MYTLLLLLQERTLWLPEQASTTAHEIDAVFSFILWGSAIMMVLVTIPMVYLAYKYRRKHANERPEPVVESHILELTWIVVPTILVAVVFFWGFRAYVGTHQAPPGAYEINVTGQKWFWTFEYPNGLNSDDLVVPAGQPIKLVMTSQDVLHSFFVPEFRIKHDVLPNRFSTVWFEAPREGVYQVLCTEYCGTAHSNMGARIRVVGRQEFYAFLNQGYLPGEEPPPMAPAALGERIYTQRQCNTCHSLDGSDGTGPTWAGLWMAPRPGSPSGVADAEYIRTSIILPQEYIVSGYENANMPSYQGILTDRDIDGVTAYIRLINGAATAADTTLAASADSTATPADDPATGGPPADAPAAMGDPSVGVADPVAPGEREILRERR